MTEVINPSVRRNLPRFSKNRNFPVFRVSNVAREPVEGRLPPLMDDTRANYLARIERKREDIYVKAVASPWTGEHGIHFLVIPDRKDHVNIPGVADLPPEALGVSLKLAESLARNTLRQAGIMEVDFGVNHSRAELKRAKKSILASFPLNLHIHVTGYSSEDMKPVGIEEIIQSSDITGRTEEALYALGEGLLFGEIIPDLKAKFPTFGTIFYEIKDQRGRKRLEMLNGSAGFDKEDLPKIIQEMDALAKQKYDELAKCFFEFDSESNQFVTKQDESARFRLLPQAARRLNIERYIGNHQNLSEGVKIGLQLLAQIAKDEQVVMERELAIAENKKGVSLTEAEKEIQTGLIANRFWTYKDLAYSMVWSAKKDDSGNITWIFGFDPKVFTIHGPHQSSANTNKLVERDMLGHLTDEQLKKVKERESIVLAQTQREISSLQIKN